MRKLFKKSIACCLALALCFTLFAGAISANALTTNPSYSSKAVSIAQGESGTIEFTVSDFSEIQGVMLKVYVPAVVASIDSVTADNFEMVVWDDEAGTGNYAIDSDDNGLFVKFMELANFTGVDTVEGFTFNINVTVAADAALGVAEFIAPVITATDGETVFAIDGEFADFTVVEPAPVEPEYVEDESLAVGRQLYMGEVFGLYYVLPQATYANAGWDDYYIEVVAKKYDENFNIYDAEPVIITKDQIVLQSGGNDYYLYDEAAGYEMLLEFTATVYCKKGDVYKKSVARTHTIAERALNGLTKALSDADAASLYVNIVNYGATAEDYFTVQFPNSDLAKNPARANDEFDAYQVYDIQEDITPVDINATSYPSAGSSANETARLGKQAQIKASNVIAYQPVLGTHDASKLYFEVSYTDSYGNLKSDSVRYSDVAAAGGWFSFEQIALYDVDKPVTASIYEDGNDTALVSNVYSIESAAARNTVAEANDIFNAVLKVGYAAKAYFDFE